MNGKNLYTAAQVVSRSGSEINALFERISELLNINISLFPPTTKISSDKIDWDRDEDEWLVHAGLKNFYFKNGHAQLACLGIKACLFGSPDFKIVGAMPLLYVLFSGGGEWGMDEFLISTANGEYKIECNCLWKYHEQVGKPGEQIKCKNMQFAYTLPLVELNDSEDIMNLILEPISMAFKGMPVARYLSKCKKVIKFDEYGGNYRVKGTRSKLASYPSLQH